MKHFSAIGQHWIPFLHLAVLNYKSYTSPNMDGLSALEWVLGCMAKIYPFLELTPEVVVTGTFKTYHNKLKKQLTLIKVYEVKDLNYSTTKEYHSFGTGQLAGGRKISTNFVALINI